MMTQSDHGSQKDYGKVAIGDVLLAKWTQRGVLATVTGRVASLDNGVISTSHGTVIAREDGGTDQLIHILTQEDIASGGINSVDMTLQMEGVIESAGGVPTSLENVNAGDMLYVIVPRDGEVSCYEGIFGTLNDGLALTPEGGVLFHDESHMGAHVHVIRKKKPKAKKPAVNLPRRAPEVVDGHAIIEFYDIAAGDRILCEWGEGDALYSIEGIAASVKDGRWSTKQGVTIAAREWVASYERVIDKTSSVAPEGWIRKAVNAVNPGELTLTISKLSDATLTREGIADKVTTRAILTSDHSVLALGQGEEAYVLPQRHRGLQTV